MKNLRKSLALILALLMVTCLAACGQKGTTAASTPEASSAPAAASTPAAPAAKDPIVFKFAHTGAEDNYFNVAAQSFKNEVESRSNGEIVIDVYPNGTLGTLREAVEGVQNGDIDITVATTTTVESFVPELAVFDLPFLIQSNEQADAALAGDVGAYLNEKIKDNGFITLGWWEIGFRNLTCNTEASTIDDLKGLQIRIMSSEIFEKMIKALNMNPVTIDYSELYTALQQGAADGQENGYNQIVESSLFEVQDYVYETKHVYNPACFMMSPSSWEKLTAEQQDIILEAAKIATGVCLEVNRSDYESNRQLCIDKGMKVLEFDLNDLRERCSGIYAEYPQFDELVKMIDSYK